MGFGKRNQEEEKAERGFVPSTEDDLNKYKKRARKNDRAHQKKKASRSTQKSAKSRQAKTQYRELFETNSQIDVFQSNVFLKFIEFCKDAGVKPPAYKSYLPKEEAEADFIYRVQYQLSRFTWPQLSKLIYESVDAVVPTKDFSEAFHFAQHAMYMALGVKEKKGALRLTDADVLDAWPVSERKRPSKEDKKMSEEERKRLAALAAKKEDEDEDEDEEDEDEESDDEEDEDEDEEEDEKPAKKKKPGKRSGKAADEEDDEDDEDEDEEDDEDDDSEDDEDDDEDDADEDDDDDESDSDEDDEEDEDEKPQKSKAKSAKKTPAKKEKPVKSKKSEKKVEKKEKKAEKVKLSDTSMVFKTKTRSKGGKKTKFLELIPKKGIKMKALAAAAKDLGVNPIRAKRWVEFLQTYEYVRVE